MNIKMTKDVMKEQFGDMIFLGMEQRMEYDQQKKEYTDVVQSTVVHVGCEKLENAIDIQVESPEIPNVKKWGKISFDGLEYAPYAGTSSYERDGRTVTRAMLVDRFKCRAVMPATPNDRLADEDGVKLEGKK